MIHTTPLIKYFQINFICFIFFIPDILVITVQIFLSLTVTSVIDPDVTE